mgnify:FL=1
MLVLPIKKKWFDMIASGQKKEEYRAFTKRYRTMFFNAADQNGVFYCILRNGYRLNSPSLTARVSLSIGYGNPEWGADPCTQYFVLSILEIK